MALDTATLRIAFAVVALTLLLLFYGVTFRGTRSAYSRWWCIALLLFSAGSAAYLFNGTTQQSWANPLGNALLVAGAASVWASGRSLRSLPMGAWRFAAAPAAAGAAAALDNPASNVWSGEPVFLAMMCLMFALTSRELLRLERSYSRVHRALALAAGLLSVFYLGRWAAFLTVGPDAPMFTAYFGSNITTVVTMALLVVVSFSMTGLSTEQLTRDLQDRATRDSLTGLLNRSGFLSLAGEELRRLQRGRPAGSLILADLDHFKDINDTYGHDAGDKVLLAFAQACTAAVRSTDVVGRYGGEEFILLLPGAGPERAEAVTTDINARLAAANQLAAGNQTVPFTLPTVSYGIAEVASGAADLPTLIAAADAALYGAKSSGRNRTVRHRTVRHR